MRLFDPLFLNKKRGLVFPRAFVLFFEKHIFELIFSRPKWRQVIVWWFLDSIIDKNVHFSRNCPNMTHTKICAFTHERLLRTRRKIGSVRWIKIPAQNFWHLILTTSTQFGIGLSFVGLWHRLYIDLISVFTVISCLKQCRIYCHGH